jgi:hypothetical protein
VPDIEVDRIDTSLIDKARKGKYLREADLEGHLVNELGENPNKDEATDDPGKVTKGDKEDKDKRPIREKEGHKLRVEDPKEFVKSDFQLQQALSYLKAWNIFEAVSDQAKTVKSASAK